MEISPFWKPWEWYNLPTTYTWICWYFGYGELVGNYIYLSSHASVMGYQYSNELLVNPCPYAPRDGNIYQAISPSIFRSHGACGVFFGNLFPPSGVSNHNLRPISNDWNHCLCDAALLPNVDGPATIVTTLCKTKIMSKKMIVGKLHMGIFVLGKPIVQRLCYF